MVLDKRFETLMNDFAKYINFTGDTVLSPPSYSAFVFEFEGVMIGIEYDNADPEAEILHLFLEIGSIPKTHRLEFYEEMLEANQFGSGTGRGSLSLFKKTDSAFLMAMFPLDGMTVPVLYSKLHFYLDYVMRWRQRRDEIVSGSVRVVLAEDVARGVEPVVEINVEAEGERAVSSPEEGSHSDAGDKWSEDYTGGSKSDDFFFIRG